MTPAILLCLVTAAIDGDTLALSCPHGPERLRLADVDAPELRGRCPAEREAARAARQHVAALLGPWEGEPGATVEITARDVRSHGRLVGRATLSDGTDVAALIAETARDAGFEALRPWPHDERGRALAPRPDWCNPSQTEP